MNKSRICELFKKKKKKNFYRQETGCLGVPFFLWPPVPSVEDTKANLPIRIKIRIEANPLPSSGL